MTEPHIQLLEDLDAEFGRVARDLERPPQRRLRWLRWRTPLLVGLLCLTLASGALAALDVLPVGSKLPAIDVPGIGEAKYSSQRTVVATGESPAGKWRLTVTESDQGKCIGLWLLETPAGGDGTDICGGPASFDAASVGGGDALPNTTLVFGPAPEGPPKFASPHRGALAELCPPTTARAISRVTPTSSRYHGRGFVTRSSTGSMRTGARRSPVS